MMRSPNYFVLVFTSLFAAAALAQSHAGIKDGTFVQAQAGNPMSGQGRTGQPGSSDADRPNEYGKPVEPMASPLTSDKDKDKESYHTEERKAKQDPARESSSQVRKSSKQQPKDSGG